MEHLGDFEPPPTKEEDDVAAVAMEEETAALNEAVAAAVEGEGDITEDVAVAAAEAAEAAETLASPAKKRVRKHNYTHVNGVNLRSCICKRPECQKEMRRWAYTGEVNHHKAGYFILPRYKDHDALNAQYTNRFLEGCVMHLFPDQITNRAQAGIFAKEHLCILQGKGPGAHHIANRHFHPRVLDHNKLWYGNKKLPIQDKFYIPGWLGERLAMHPEEDRCVVYNTESYYALPTYTGNEFLQDLEKQEYQNHVVHGQALLIREMKEKIKTLRLQRPAARPAQQQAAKIQELTRQNKRLKELCRESGIDYKEVEEDEDGDRKSAGRKKVGAVRKRNSSSTAAKQTPKNKKTKKEEMEKEMTEEFDPASAPQQDLPSDKGFLGKLIQIVEDHQCAAEPSPDAPCWKNALKAAYVARDQPAPLEIDSSEVIRFQDQMKNLWTTMEQEMQNGEAEAGSEQYNMAANQWKLFQEKQHVWEHNVAEAKMGAPILEPASLEMDKGGEVAPLPADLGLEKGEDEDDGKPKAMAL